LDGVNHPKPLIGDSRGELKPRIAVPV
jgi:hypothetical protein